MSRWQREPDVLWREGLDDVLLLPPGADEPVTVTGPGALLWLLLAEPATLDKIVSALAEQYATTAAVVRRDIAPLLERLQELGAVQCRT